MNSVVGAPVRGADFFGRDRFVELVWQKLEAGSVLLAAPRRFGKTSVMYRMIDQPRGDYKIVHADLEELSDPTSLLLELVVKLSKDTKMGRLLDGVTAISKEIWTGLRDTVDEVELYDVKLKLREQLRPQWEDIGKQIFKRIGAAEHPVLFILDELPMMIDRMARSDTHRDEAKVLLHWLRALRQSPHLQNVRFLVAGSIGIDAVLNELGEISTINDFEKLQLEAFTPAVADDFLRDLARSKNFMLSRECRAKMLELTGIFVPYFLQILFSEVYKTHWLTQEPVTPELTTRIYHEKVLGMECKTYFEHYYGRLRDYYRPQEEKVVKRLLRELARTGEMTPDICFALYRETAGGDPDLDEFHVTLTNLENDFYIRYNAETRRYEFACKLLRDWWLRHYALEAA